jgi:hypothetical protein
MLGSVEVSYSREMGRHSVQHESLLPESRLCQLCCFEKSWHVSQCVQGSFLAVLRGCVAGAGDHGVSFWRAIGFLACACARCRVGMHSVLFYRGLWWARGCVAGGCIPAVGQLAPAARGKAEDSGPCCKAAQLRACARCSDYVHVVLPLIRHAEVLRCSVGSWCYKGWG